MNHKFDVIVVGYGPHAQRCVDSIGRNSIGSDYLLTYIDNNPEANPIQFDDTMPVRYVRMPENVGWLKGANAGLQMSTAPYVVLMNDDAIVWTDGWLEKMRPAATMAVMGPRGGGGYQGRVPHCDGLTQEVAPTLTLDGWGIGNFPLSFFCVMFSRPALNEIGCLDEQFSPGYGEDDDWLARAHLAGWGMGIACDVLVKHESSGYGGQRGELQARNVERLRAKYKNILTEKCSSDSMAPRTELTGSVQGPSSTRLTE